MSRYVFRSVGAFAGFWIRHLCHDTEFNEVPIKSSRCIKSETVTDIREVYDQTPIEWATGNSVILNSYPRSRSRNLSITRLSRFAGLIPSDCNERNGQQ